MGSGGGSGSVPRGATVPGRERALAHGEPLVPRDQGLRLPRVGKANAILAADFFETTTLTGTRKTS